MAREVGPKGNIFADATLPVVIVTLALVPLLGSFIVWVAGSLATAIFSGGNPVPPYSTNFIADLFTTGPSAIWPETASILVWLLTFVVLVSTISPLFIIWRWWWKRDLSTPTLRKASSKAMANKTDVEALTPRAVTTRAVALRPSLRGFSRVPPNEAGVMLGQLEPKGPVLRASWEDVLVAIMAPRAGKTTSLAVPAILNAPGAVVATSNKADLWAATAQLRAQSTGEPVWVFDPQRIAYSTQQFWWNPLEGVTTVEESHRLAGHFVQEIRGDKGDRDFWSEAAQDLLSNLILAAGSTGRTLADVFTWLNEPTLSTPVELLREQGHRPAAASLEGRQNGAIETREGIYETARTAAQCLRDAQIMAWVTPPTTSLVELDIERFVESRATLYLLSKDGAGAAAPLIAALTDRVMRCGTRAAERRGGRLDPPILIVLDEAANVCRIRDLPELYSHLGSRGIIPMTILQSYRQGTRVWGDAGMDTLWSAATIKLIGAGLDDAKFVEDISRLIGDFKMQTRSVTSGRGSNSTSVSLQNERILGPEKVRALPKGSALLLATGCKAAMVKLLPWYKSPQASLIKTAVSNAEAALTERASQQRQVIW